MTDKTVKCPSCGAQTGGKFCSECGAPLGERACPKCSAKLAARAKFCPDCGTVVAPGGARAPLPAGGLGDRLPWIIAAVAVFALIAVAIVVVGRKGPAGAESASTAPSSGPFDPNARATTDLTSLTPRQSADRLFDRVMRASEAGDTAQVQFFGPMTIQAYGNVDSLDADARLHIGLVAISLGWADTVTAQATAIGRAGRNHLFALALRARAAELKGDQAAARTAYKAFEDNYVAERAKNLPEYAQHETYLAQVRATAQQAGR